MTINFFPSNISLQQLYVRDCIMVRAGKRERDKPYIAKIGSIWKEDEGY